MEFVYSARNANVPVAFVAFEAMHTVFEMVLVRLDESDARKLAEETERLVLGFEKKLNRHDVESAFSRINASAGQGSVPVDEDIFGILQFCEAFRGSTEGYFDISALSEAPICPAYRLDPVSSSVTLSAEGIVLDAGGFGKGYALDHVRKLLQETGVTGALLNFGDSSVVAVGRHPFGDCWQVSSPYGGGVFRLADMSLSVSGCRPGGEEHIIDPATRRPVGKGTLVAVEGRSAFVCEVLSTALYAAPEEARKRIIKEFEGYRYTEIRQDLSSWIEENL